MNSFLVLNDAIAASSNAGWENTVDGVIVSWFNNGFNGAVPSIVGNLILIILSLLLAVLFGGIIGYQREVNGHAAGFRTHILIALGSALIMILSIYGLSNGTTRDPMRFAAAGVTGIGFLGAGSIIQNGFSVKGLTTAASIWVTMAIGMASGAGYFVIATITAVITFVCLSLFTRLERLVSRKNKNIMVVVNEDIPILTLLLELGEKMGIAVKDIASTIIKHEDKKYVRIVFKLGCKDKDRVETFLNELTVISKAIEIKVLN